MSTINGTNGSDLRIGTSEDDLINGGNGNDILLGSGGDDTINGGNGIDLLAGGTGDDVLHGGNGTDVVEGGDGDDAIYGDNGADLLHGGAGDDTVQGGAGTDIAVYSGNLEDYRFVLGADGALRVTDLRPGSVDGTDVVSQVEYFLFADGLVCAQDLPLSTGTDTADYSHTTLGVNVDLAAGIATGPEIGTETLIGIQNVIGGSGDDILVGNTGDNQLFGGDGDDGMAGGLGGNDLFDGGNGLDRVNFSGAMNSINVQLAAGIVTVGSFTKTLQAVELIRGTAQADTYDATGFSGSSTNAGSDGTFNEFEGMGGDDTITGNGNTRVSYFNAAAGVSVNLGTGTAVGLAPGDLAGIGTDTFTGVNAVRGSEFDDELRGSAGNDTLLGGAGNDFLGGGPGDDTLNGGAGVDTASYGQAGAAVIVDLVAGTATGGGGSDSLTNIENINGSAHNDVLRGNGGNNTLTGNNGDDFLIGRAGNDHLDGGAGIDIARFFGARSQYTFSPGTVTGPDGTDTTAGVELLQFDDAFMLGFGLSPINLANFGGLTGGLPIFGRTVSDFLTVGLNGQGRLIDLGGDNDTLTIGLGGPTPQSINLNVANVETIGTFAFTGSLTLTMAPTSVLNGTTVDLGSFGDALNLADGNNVVTTIGVETINAFGNGDDTVNYVGDATMPGHINLGGGTNVLNLAGVDSDFSLELFGSNLTVYGQTTGAAAGNEHVTLSNGQAGTTFDLGAGYDTLQLFSNPPFTNIVTVRNVEEVTSVGFGFDSIIIAGNSGGVTTVTAGGGADQIYASADEDHFRYTMTGQSAYDVPFGGERDLIDGFDASQDKFVFDGIPAPDFAWEVIEFAGVDILRVDFEGDADDLGDADPGNDIGWDMAFELDNLAGPLTNDNFLIL